MNREDALAYMKKHGPLPEQPPLEGRKCLHAASPRPCSCHLTLEQQGVAAELGNYTLYLFGLPHRGRVKVPYTPPATAPVVIDEAHRHANADLARVAEALSRPTRQHVAPEASVADEPHVAAAPPAPLSAAARPKRAFDPVYNAAYAKARRRGAEAVAAFKAEWAARKAAA